MTVCDDCKWNIWEEITQDLWEHFCEEDSKNFETEDGCYHYEERKEYDDGRY